MQWLLWLRKVKDSWTLTKKEHEIQIQKSVYNARLFQHTITKYILVMYYCWISKVCRKPRSDDVRELFMISVFPQLKGAFAVQTWILPLHSNRLCYRLGFVWELRHAKTALCSSSDILHRISLVTVWVKKGCSDGCEFCWVHWEQHLWLQQRQT